MEREFAHLQCSPLMEQKEYTKMIRFLQQRCQKTSLDINTRVQSGKKSPTPEEVFFDTILSYLHQLQMIEDEVEQRGDLERVYRWFLANKKLLFPTQKTFQKHPPRLGMLPPSTAEGSEVEDGPSSFHKTQAVSTRSTVLKVPSTTPVEDNTPGGQTESPDGHMTDTALQHHPRWNYSDLSKLSSMEFREAVMSMTQEVGYDLMDEKDARQEWMCGRSALWTLAKEVLPAGDVVNNDQLMQCSNDLGEKVGEYVCTREECVVSSCKEQIPEELQGPVDLPMTVTIKDGESPNPLLGPDRPAGDLRPPTTTLTLGTIAGYHDNHANSSKQPKKLLPFVAGFRTECYKVKK